MAKINHPDPDFRIRNEEGREVIFDSIRKLWVRLTPEEWVRQNLLQYLVKVKQYPAAVIAVETEIRLNDLRKRCDIVVYHQHKPWMIIECKEMNVPLGSSVLDQVLRYNMSLAVEYIVITNGNETHLWHLQTGNATAENVFPDYLRDS